MIEIEMIVAGANEIEIAIAVVAETITAIVGETETEMMTAGGVVEVEVEVVVVRTAVIGLVFVIWADDLDLGITIEVGGQVLGVGGTTEVVEMVAGQEATGRKSGIYEGVALHIYIYMCI